MEDSAAFWVWLQRLDGNVVSVDEPATVRVGELANGGDFNVVDGRLGRERAAIERSARRLRILYWKTCDADGSFRYFCNRVEHYAKLELGNERDLVSRSSCERGFVDDVNGLWNVDDDYRSQLQYDVFVYGNSDRRLLSR